MLQSQWFTFLTALSALLLFRRVRQVDWALAVALELSSFAGAFWSGYMAKQFSAHSLTLLLVVLVGASGMAMLFDFQAPRRLDSRAPWHWIRRFGGVEYRANLAQGLPLSFFIGISSGLTGAVGGFLKIPMLVRLFGVPIAVAFGSSAFMVTLTATGGLLGHLARGDALWREPVLLSLFVLAGSQIGPRLTMRSRPTALRKRFAAYLFALAAVVLVSFWFVDSPA